MTERQRRNEDSGLIDLDALLRQSSPELPPSASDSLEGVAADASVARPPLPEAAAAQVAVAEPPAAPRAVAEVPPPSARQPAATASRRMRRGAVGALLLAAALVGVVAVVAVARRAPSDVASRPAAASAPAADLHPPPKATSVATLAAPPLGDRAPDAKDPAFDAKDLPSVAPSAALAPHAATTATVRITTSALADAPVRGAGDLGGAIRDAVGPRASSDAPAASASAEVNARQLRPSPGAVVGAIQAVLPKARACLGPDDPVRSATLVFRSDGSVARVDLAGARPSDDCVKAALAGARTAPFLDETFVTRATVRP